MIKFRDMEKVRGIISEATNLDISYAYDDLVFPDHAAFLIQFDDENENNLFCYFHDDCAGKDKEEIWKKLSETSIANGCSLKQKGRFSMEQKGEEVEIHFKTEKL